MTPRGHAVSILITAFWFLTGCQQELDERPPAAPGCTGPGCVPVGGLPPGSQGGSGGGPGGAGGRETADWTGNVRELLDDGFRSSQPFTGTAVVSVQAAQGALVTAAWNGTDPFEVRGVPLDAPTWVQIAPERNRGVLPTLHPVDITQTSPIDLGLVRADTLDLVLLLLTVPGERLAGRAQLILSFRDPLNQGAGQSGVRVALPEAAFVTYRNRGTWSELEPETDTSGLVVLGNISAPEFPGITKRVQLRGTRTGSIEVRIAADAVSLVEVATP